MRFILLMSVAMLSALPSGVCAEEPSSQPNGVAAAGDEACDFDLLTPLSPSEEAQIRGERVDGPAPYSLVLASAFDAANAFRLAYLGGCRTGMIQRNVDGTYSFVGCGD